MPLAQVHRNIEQKSCSRGDDDHCDDDGEDDDGDDDGEDDNDDETKTAEEEGRVIYQESLMRGRVRWATHLFPWLPISHCLRNQDDVACLVSLRLAMFFLSFSEGGWVSGL